jgi:hypothetical protein
MRDYETLESGLDEIVADLENEMLDEAGGQDMEADELDGEEELDELLADELGRGRGMRARRPADLRAAIERQRSRNAGFVRAVRGLAPQVRRRGGRLVLSIPAGGAGRVAASLGIKAKGVEILARSAAMRPARAAAPAVSRELDMETGGSGACPGRTDFSTHWWGFRLWLNECQTKAMLGGMKAGAGAAAICTAAVPAPHAKVACGIIAGLIAIGGGVIEGIDNLGGNRGIVVSKPWLPIAPPIVWHQ